MGQVEVFINLVPWLTIQISLAGCENLTQINSFAVEQLETAVTDVQYYPSCFTCIYMYVQRYMIILDRSESK